MRKGERRTGNLFYFFLELGLMWLRLCRSYARHTKRTGC